MRLLNIKIINHTLYKYVLVMLLLLGFVVEAKNNSLETQATEQLNAILEKHGLVTNPKWHTVCLSLIEALSLNLFNECLVIDAKYPNAYSFANGKVAITWGLLNQIRNNDQLAHILAHEHAHLSLNHHQQVQNMLLNPPTFFTKSRFKRFHRKLEKEADEYAEQVLLAHQKDPLQIHHYLKRIEPWLDEVSQDHEKLKKRIQTEALPAEFTETFWHND